jgi:putative phage-type endonuclease
MYQTPVDERVLKLSQRPQPVQKSKEWHEARRAALTASDVASALPRDECSLKEYINEFGQWLKEEIKFSSRASMNPYETTNKLIMKKLGAGKPFVGNTATAWGNMFERVAQLTYEKLHHVDLLEFGLLFDESNNWVAASPDGIRSDALALLEIKCPLIREVNDPPPLNYWCQMMWQMQTCKIDKTHYMDCCINQYVTRRTWLSEIQSDIQNSSEYWEVMNCHHEQSKSTAFAIKEGKTFKYGALLEVETYDFTDQVIDVSYVYPTEIHDTLEQIDDWISENVKEIETDLFKRVRIIYYKLDKIIIFSVSRSDVWFDRNKERLLKLWNGILEKRKTLADSTESMLSITKQLRA